jgi:hypothetical protein
VTDEEVIAELAGHGIAVVPFPLRMEPHDGVHPGDKVFCFPVPLDDGNYLGVTWSFGYPSEDEMQSWKPRWHGVHGPMNRKDLEDFARAQG